MNLGPYGKALGALIAGVIGWATLVVHSPSAAITAEEWIVLATTGAQTLAVFGIANAAKSG